MTWGVSEPRELWRGLARRGLAWPGMARRGEAWHGMAWMT